MAAAELAPLDLAAEPACLGDRLQQIDQHHSRVARAGYSCYDSHPMRQPSCQVPRREHPAAASHVRTECCRRFARLPAGRPRHTNRRKRIGRASRTACGRSPQWCAISARSRQPWLRERRHHAARHRPDDVNHHLGANVLITPQPVILIRRVVAVVDEDVRPHPQGVPIAVWILGRQCSQGARRQYVQSGDVEHRSRCGHGNRNTDDAVPRAVGRLDLQGVRERIGPTPSSLGQSCSNARPSGALASRRTSRPSNSDVRRVSSASSSRTTVPSGKVTSMGGEGVWTVGAETNRARQPIIAP